MSLLDAGANCPQKGRGEDKEELMGPREGSGGRSGVRRTGQMRVAVPCTWRKGKKAGVATWWQM